MVVYGEIQTRNEAWIKKVVCDEISKPFYMLMADDNGIAFSMHYYEHFMSFSPFTKVISVDGRMPSHETIANRTYPYVTKVYCVIRKSLPANHDARRLRDWLRTEEGQSVIAESGYVPSM